MSHLQGTDYVGAMVVLEDGLPKRSDYRRFKVSAVQGNDDYGAMHEVLTRRLRYLLDRDDSAGAAEPGEPAEPHPPNLLNRPNLPGSRTSSPSGAGAGARPASPTRPSCSC